MKIRVSKVFANYLNKLAKQGVLNMEHAEVRTFSESCYSLHVGEPMDADYYDDFDYDDDGNLLYKAIVVTYPYEFHALPKYLTTELLTTTYNWRKVGNEEELIEMLKDLINI